MELGSKVMVLWLGILVISTTSGMQIHPEQIQDGYQIHHINTTVELAEGQISNYTTQIDLTLLESSALEGFVLEIPLLLNNVSASLNSDHMATMIMHDEGQTVIQLTSISQPQLNEQYTLTITGKFEADTTVIDDHNIQFFFDWDMNIIADNITVTIMLPKYAVLLKERNTFDIFPKDASFVSSGDRIGITWIGLSNNGNLNTELFLQYEQGSVNDGESRIWTPLTTVLLILLLVVSSCLIGILIYWKYGKQEKREEGEATTRIVTSIKPVILSPQEEEILGIIAKYDGGILQSDLVEMLNFSRARVSQYLTAFEEKGLITKHKAGRQNYITLAADIVFDVKSQ